MSNIDPYRFLRSVWLALFLAWALSGAAQNEVQERSFDQERLERYRNNPDYKYERAVPDPPEKPKPEELIQRDPGEFSEPNFDGDGPDLSGLVKGLFWVLIIGGGTFLLLQIFRVRLSSLFRKKSDEAKIEIEELVDPEDISNIDFEDPIRAAIDAGMYRKATRLLYLKALREMQDRAMIRWRREKTNRDYLRELKIKELRPHFKHITYLFEYIWYGEVPVDKEHFNRAYANFVEFDQQLRRYDAQ